MTSGMYLANRRGGARGRTGPAPPQDMRDLPSETDDYDGANLQDVIRKGNLATPTWWPVGSISVHVHNKVLASYDDQDAFLRGKKYVPGIFCQTALQPSISTKQGKVAAYGHFHTLADLLCYLSTTGKSPPPPKHAAR